MNLRRKTISGILWLSVANFFNQLLSLAVFVILARELSLDEFGVAMLAILIMNIFSMFFKDGIIDFLVREQDGTFSEKLKTTAFWLSLIFGLLLTTVLVLVVAPIFDHFYGGPAAGYILVMSPMMIFSSVTILNLAVVRRNYAFKVAASRNVANGILTGAIAIFLAFDGWGAWALIYSRVLGALGAALILVWQEPFFPKFGFSTRCAREIIRYSMPLVSARLVTYLSSRSPEMALALVGGPAALAIYRVGCRVVEVLNSLLVDPVANVLLTTFSKMEQGEAAKNAPKITAALVGILAPAFLGAASIAVPLTGVLYGERWQESASVMMVLCFQIVPVTVRLVLVMIYKTARATRRLWDLALIELALSVLLMASASFWGEAYVAVAVVLQTILMAALHIGLRPDGVQFPAASAVADVVAPSLSALVMFVGVYFTVSSVAYLDVWIQLLSGVAFGLILYLGLLLLVFPSWMSRALEGMKDVLPTRFDRVVALVQKLARRGRLPR